MATTTTSTASSNHTDSPLISEISRSPAHASEPANNPAQLSILPSSSSFRLPRHGFIREKALCYAEPKDKVSSFVALTKGSVGATKRSGGGSKSSEDRVNQRDRAAHDKATRKKRRRKGGGKERAILFLLSVSLSPFLFHPRSILSYEMSLINSTILSEAAK